MSNLRLYNSPTSNLQLGSMHFHTFLPSFYIPFAHHALPSCTLSIPFAMTSQKYQKNFQNGSKNGAKPAYMQEMSQQLARTGI